MSSYIAFLSPWRRAGEQLISDPSDLGDLWFLRCFIAFCSSTGFSFGYLNSRYPGFPFVKIMIEFIYWWADWESHAAVPWMKDPFCCFEATMILDPWINLFAAFILFVSLRICFIVTPLLRLFFNRFVPATRLSEEKLDGDHPLLHDEHAEGILQCFLCEPEAVWAIRLFQCTPNSGTHRLPVYH